VESPKERLVYHKDLLEKIVGSTNNEYNVTITAR